MISSGTGGGSKTGTVAVVNAPLSSTTTTTTRPHPVKIVKSGAAATTTTVPPVPPGQTIGYASYVDPTYTRGATNPLVVTYVYTSAASTVINGATVALSELPAGTLTLSDDGTVACSMGVGRDVTGGTCAVTYAAFGMHSVIANYVVGSNSYMSDTLTSDIEAYKTVTVASIHGGGSLGGLVFDANVTDENGNAVTVGSVSMTISDVTQGWSYDVGGTVGADGADATAFGCLFIENYPSAGDYAGCGLFGPIVVSVGTDDHLEINATYDPSPNWSSSLSPNASYTVPT
jgi:hypothetical protein